MPCYIKMHLVEMAVERTSSYLEDVPKLKRKDIGQFFTPTKIACLMADCVKNDSETIVMLDPGAGTGILTAAVLEKVLERGQVKRIFVDLFETNEEIIPILFDNMTSIQKKMTNERIDFTFNVISEDFITYNKARWEDAEQSKQYDLVISNPPYVKIGKESEQACIMESIVFGQPNLYCLFMAMASKLLKDDGEFIFIVPRSFTSGLYFSKFREWFLNEMKILEIFTFESRNSAFISDKVLQETIVIYALKTKTVPQFVTISESKNIVSSGLTRSIRVEYDFCMPNDGNYFILIPTNESDLKTMSLMNDWGSTLMDRGYMLRTGQVVDFREKEWLREKYEVGAVPLIWPCNFKNGVIEIYDFLEKKPQYFLRCEETNRVMLAPGNYVLIKRFTAKEEPRRLQCAVLPERFFEDHGGVCIENHVNILTKKNGSMSADEMMGLFVLFGSSYSDDYYRLLNGSTQVNATEFNSMCSPTAEKIAEFGLASRDYPALDTKACDTIINDAMYAINSQEVKGEIIWENWMRLKTY